MKVTTWGAAFAAAAALGLSGILRAEDGTMGARAETADIVVYGATSAGVAAAVQASRMGHSVALICPDGHVGGLTTGGLGWTDIGNKHVIGGFAREFYRRVRERYADDAAWTRQRREEYRRGQTSPGDDAMWTFEPHAASAIFAEVLRECGVSVVFGERLDRRPGRGVRAVARRIRSIAMESGRTFAGRMFIDATYEGDLMAAAGVSYHVGREANAVYGETLNGVQTARTTNHQFMRPVSPYVVPGDPASGLLPGVHGDDPGTDGEGDRRIQAYCFRVCMTDVPENRVPFPKPAGYDPARYELLARYLETGWNEVFRKFDPLPNRKTDTNNHGAFSSDNIGMNYEYPDGSYAEREAIVREHETYQKGLLWFLANDPRVPDAIRAEMSRWGLAADEFAATGNWPPQLYVREARRLVGDVVMTEHHCRGAAVVSDPVGMGAYGMDSHNTQRYVDADGQARNEGNIQVGTKPYGISYRAILPKREECENLAVPVCLSASHIAYGSIRMEPVFMILGQSAATAACLALEGGGALQDLDYAVLRERLLRDGHVLEYEGEAPREVISVDPASVPGVLVDDDAALRVGFGNVSRAVGPFVGSGYVHDGNEGKGEQRIEFRGALPAAGRYEVRLAFAAHGNRAANVPVTVRHADGEALIRVDQRKPGPGDGLWLSLGTFRFAAEGVVVVANDGTEGYVLADAVSFVPAGTD